MKRIGLIVSIVLFFPFSVQAQNAVNAGFVEGIWFSKETVFADEPVRVYAALRNNTESDLTGTVVFKDGDSVIAEKDISALSGRLIETWADWKPVYGEHTISATLTDIRLHRVGEEAQTVSVTSGLSERFVFIDRDTDNDGVGNKGDKDDDNDGVSDAEEESQGTDPLTPNVPTNESDSDNTSDENATNTTTANKETQSNTGRDTTDKNEERTGFEKYVSDGTMRAILTNVTEKVNESKESLDAYRNKRNTEKERTEKAKETASTEMIATSSATSSEMSDATITRTQLEPERTGFMGTIVTGIVGIFDGLYTLLLWITSTVLGHPALVQLLLLLTILYGAYRLAKWYGARRQMQ